MKSVMIGATAIKAGERQLIAAGGMESMSKIPHYVSIRTPTAYSNSTMVDGIIQDGLTDVYNNILMGACTEKVNAEMGITREMQD
jgi:acetyl-CoA C-acetyltransferase